MGKKGFLMLAVRKKGWIVIGEPSDNKDIRVQVVEMDRDKGRILLGVGDEKGRTIKQMALGETIRFGNDISMQLAEFRGDNHEVIFAFDGPKHIPVDREKVFHQKAVEALLEESVAFGKGRDVARVKFSRSETTHLETGTPSGQKALQLLMQKRNLRKTNENGKA